MIQMLIILRLQKTWESLTPMGRMGDPEDLSVRRIPFLLHFRLVLC